MKLNYVSGVAVAVLLACVLVEGAPFPAPLIKLCKSTQGCCPLPDSRTPVDFTFRPNLPIRIRRAAHLADDAYIAKYRLAYKRMAALPNTDPRSLYAQANLHCAYCGGAFKFNGSSWPLEIHGGWFFFAWHRAFLYFHERILASLIGDDSFSLLFWNWDNQSPGAVQGNVMPSFFDDPIDNPLYNANRDQCARPPNVVDLGYISQTPGGPCPDSLGLDTYNNDIMRLQMAAETARLFHGAPVRYNTRGGRSPGNVERTPHGNVHIFTGDPSANTRVNPLTLKPYAVRDDMGNLNRAAVDPLFYSHHANLDRLWAFWIAQGGMHSDYNDPDYLNSKFIFYDENKTLISISVSQVLNLANLRYDYDQGDNLWTIEPPLDPPLAPAAAPVTIASIMSFESRDESPPPPPSGPRICSPPNSPRLGRMIKNAKLLKKGWTVFSGEPLTFRARRIDPSGNSFEYLTINDLVLDWTKPAQIHAFLFLPSATEYSTGCHEFFGTFSHIPQADHHRPSDFSMQWTLGLTSKLQDIRKPYVSHVVVTLVQVESNQQIKFKGITMEIDRKW
ncbi:polyphenol oxidase A1, chloroplastic [Physcomitrium patens]|uniref:Tyrosinase copper-binding domain-containing protein n=1 Tax=Physcomitrium patens TaxID=3218 RepID=A9T5A8_PHYPA|nr:polyphenol oxidase A1, chloroplastic-like [Physcomitrium patens]PNR32093.1 hypothetical protein PHYPA_026218 [Physcomitrium patens]|eukprot:XP_024358854.1 polyphenol oxidase A1, chloroplastic-like [Physcomitrella patens]